MTTFPVVSKQSHELFSGWSQRFGVRGCFREWERPSITYRAHWHAKICCGPGGHGQLQGPPASTGCPTSACFLQLLTGMPYLLQGAVFLTKPSRTILHVGTIHVIIQKATSSNWAIWLRSLLDNCEGGAYLQNGSLKKPTCHNKLGVPANSCRKTSEVVRQFMHTGGSCYWLRIFRREEAGNRPGLPRCRDPSGRLRWWGEIGKWGSLQCPCGHIVRKLPNIFYHVTTGALQQP